MCDINEVDYRYTFPQTNKLTFGLELECIHIFNKKCNTKKRMSKINSVVKKHKLKIGCDESVFDAIDDVSLGELPTAITDKRYISDKKLKLILNEEFGQSYEIKTYPTTNIDEILLGLHSFIKLHPLITTKSSGLHIHVGFSYSDKDILNIIKLWCKEYKRFYKIANPHCCRYNYFDSLVDLLDLTNIDNLSLDKTNISSNMRCDLNLKHILYFLFRTNKFKKLSNNYKHTIEFRLFNSTLNIKEIKRNLLLVKNFMEQAIGV